MRIGFSSSVCPEWQIADLVQQAKTLGYDGIEIRGLQGHSHLPTSPVMADPARIREAFASQGVAMLCIGTQMSFDTPDRRELADRKARLGETLRLAGELGCSSVSIRSGDVPRYHNRDGVLCRIVESLREMAPVAAEHNVAILVENDGNLATSRDLWYIVDASGHPAVRCRWNPCRSFLAGEQHGLVVPRIGRLTSLVTLLDTVSDPAGPDGQYVAPGQGRAGLERFLLLMQGIGSDADLVVDGPATGVQGQPTEFLSSSLAWIRQELARLGQVPELSAYKGDKNAPRFASRTPRAVVNG